MYALGTSTGPPFLLRLPCRYSLVLPLSRVQVASWLTMASSVWNPIVFFTSGSQGLPGESGPTTASIGKWLISLPLFPRLTGEVNQRVEELKDGARLRRLNTPA